MVIFQSINEVKIIPFDLIVRPLRFLTAIRFNYMRKHGVKFKDVRLQANFYQTEEEVLAEASKTEGLFGFTRLILLGAKWDYEK